ncbi:site-specific integrase [Myxococcus phage Mx9]|nr:Int [Myxococcus phage Mx9]QRG42414.1 Int [Cloning vector pMYC21]WFG54149.1 site-specific integrase [Myxococcus phage Mx9]
MALRGASDATTNPSRLVQSVAAGPRATPWGVSASWYLLGRTATGEYIVSSDAAKKGHPMATAAERLPTSPIDVNALALEVARLVALQQQSATPPSSGRTFGAVADDWLITEAKRLVCPDNERRHLRHMEALWGMTDVELTPRVVKAHLAGLLKPEGPLSAATVNKVRSTGKRIIKAAQINGEWGPVNPFGVLDREKEAKAERLTLTAAECRAVLPHFRADRRREFLFQVFLGPRPGEEKALLKEDVDVEARTVIFRRSNGRDTTKTGRERRVPVPDELWPVLLDAMQASPSDLVFPNAKGERQRADTKMTRVLRTALSAAGVVVGWDYICRTQGCGYRDVQSGGARQERRCPACDKRMWASGRPKPAVWYGLRHTAATLHRKAGCDPLVIKLVLGHAAVDTTDDVYTHLDEDYCRAELNKLSLKAPPPPPTHQGGSDGGPDSGRNTYGEGGTMHGLGDLQHHRARAWEARALPTELPPRNLAGGIPAPLLSVKDVAASLSVSTAKVYQLLAAGVLPTVWVGQSRRVKREDLDAYIARATATGGKRGGK